MKNKFAISSASAGGLLVSGLSSNRVIGAFIICRSLQDPGNASVLGRSRTTKGTAARRHRDSTLDVQRNLGWLPQKFKMLPFLSQYILQTPFPFLQLPGLVCLGVAFTFFGSRTRHCPLYRSAVAHATAFLLGSAVHHIDVPQR